MNRLLLLSAALLSTTVAQQLPALTIIGKEGTITEANLPLAKCQGDCNKNIDCADDLLCFSRGGATTIPGCSGRAELDGTDYCWDPTDKPVPGVIAHVGNNGNPAVLFPLPRCAGQCASDADCQDGLVCLVREKIDDPVYGCQGDLLDRVDYCVNPGDIPGSTVGTPTTGAGGAATGTGPDADATDADADAEADADAPVTTNATADGGLGVDGTDGEEVDIAPLMGVLTIAYLGGDATMEPLAECHGNCGLDVPCAEGLTCFNRTDAQVPGCGGHLLPNIHYCVADVAAEPLVDIELDHPSLVGVLAVALLDGAPVESLPLKHCQGDCVSHDMCDSSVEPLSCYVREDGTGDVPGCSGVAVDDVGYCVKTVDMATPTTPNNDGGKASASGATNISFWWTLSAILPTLAASAMVCVE